MPNYKGKKYFYFLVSVSFEFSRFFLPLVIKIEGLADILVGGDIAKDKYEMKCEAKHSKFTLTSSIKQDFTGETAGVVGVQVCTHKYMAWFTYKSYNFQDLQLGGQASYDVKKQKLLGNQLGAAYKVSKNTTIAAILYSFGFAFFLVIFLLFQTSEKTSNRLKQDSAL